ncbi:MAG: hypothetical protein KDK29_14120 [Sedimentitalea sp.]|nr:hypothetical protein [Sedimentitalea sp.]
MFHFRRRWPAELRTFGAPEFLSISLRTNLLREAVKRSADLLTALEAGEIDVLKELQDNPVAETRVRSMLQEIVRRSVASMIARQECDAPDAHPDAYLDRITSETRRIQEAQRARDWTVATGLAGDVAKRNGIAVSEVEAPAVARQVLAVMRQLNELSARVERDFDDPLHAGREMLLNHGLSPTRDALKPPTPLSEAIEKACQEAPPDVETKIRVVGKLALVHFGDIPVSSLVLEQSFDFLRMIWMLPKGWGKSHGRNRHGQPGRDLCPLDEIREADRRDAQLIARITSLDRLSVPD